MIPNGYAIININAVISKLSSLQKTLDSKEGADLATDRCRPCKRKRYGSSAVSSLEFN